MAKGKKHKDTPIADVMTTDNTYITKFIRETTPTATEIVSAIEQAKREVVKISSELSDRGRRDALNERLMKLFQPKIVS